MNKKETLALANEIEQMTERIRKGDKKEIAKARRVLFNAGIIDKKGRVTKLYGGDGDNKDPNSMICPS